MPTITDHISDGLPNRVMDAILLYSEQETQFYINNPLGNDSLQFLSYKLQYYSNIYETYRKNANAGEKLSLQYLKHEMGKMQARLNPTIINQIFYSPVLNAIRNFINGNNRVYVYHNNIIKARQRELIGEHNFQSLAREMKKAGFKHEIEGTLRKYITQDLASFHLPYVDIHCPGAYFVLHYKKIQNINLYYFEKWDAISSPNLDALLNKNIIYRQHTFSSRDELQFTAGETANLVKGKYVCKNVNGKEIWLLLDNAGSNKQQPFKKVSFKLEEAINKLPVKLNDSQYQNLVETLKAGGKKEVPFTINGRTMRYTLEAAPDRKTVDVLDKHGNLIDKDRLFDNQNIARARKVAEDISQKEDREIDISETIRSGIRLR